MTFCIRFIVLAICFVSFGQVHARLPNIVFILADDMGYGDVATLNPNSTIPSPHLDSLAADGMTFLDAHSPSAVCTPTRYGILTGRYCFRSRMKRGVLNGYSEPLIDTDRPTVADIAKQAGYHTGIVGKWHLGLGWTKNEDGKIQFDKPVTVTPNDYGFDESYIIPASLDFPPYVYIHNRQVTTSRTVTQPAQKFPAFLRKGPRGEDLIMQDCLDHLTTKATEFLQEQKGSEEPFLLYFPLTAPHKPVLPHPRFQGKTKLGPYGDFIVQVDATVGMVLDAIDDAGVRDNTLVIYTSDNGSFMYRQEGTDHTEDESVQAFSPDHHTSNHVFRGTKGDIWEAGHHVPCFARWPGVIKPKSTCDQTVCSVDFCATVASIVGRETPNQCQDSYSWLPLMKGQDPPTNRQPVIHHSGGGMFSIRSGNWKLVLGNGSGGRERPRGKPFERPYALFDMTKDLSERRNVIDKHPGVAVELEQRCLQMIR